MSFTVEEVLRLPVDVQQAFDTLVDLRGWARWMPPTFRPLDADPGPLTPGTRATVGLRGLPFGITLEVTTVERNRAVVWEGGRRGLLWATHRFEFEAGDEGRASLVRSVESWAGALASPLWPVLEPATRVMGRAQLAGLRRGALAR